MVVTDPERCEGGLKIAPNAQVISATGKPMMVPELQDSGIMTEDMIAEQERVMLSLGTGAEAATVRARMQTGQLKSDMESFKAANCHAELEDFVRWHSPRDWIVDPDTGVGKLSSRMLDPGNLWLEVWNSARRIPASRQKPLFNHEKEGEKALFFLEELIGNLRELLFQCLPTIFFVAYNAAVSNPLTEQIPRIAADIPLLTSELCAIDWTNMENLDVSMTEFLAALNTFEYKLSVAQSLLYKLPMQIRTVDRMLASLYKRHDDYESEYDGTLSCELRDPLERNAVCDLLTDEEMRLEVPSYREFVLKVLVPYPLAESRLLPQRMYALLQDGEFRVFEAIAYDEDKTS